VGERIFTVWGTLTRESGKPQELGSDLVVKRFHDLLAKGTPFEQGVGLGVAEWAAPNVASRSTWPPPERGQRSLFRDPFRVAERRPADVEYPLGLRLWGVERVTRLDIGIHASLRFKVDASADVAA